MLLVVDPQILNEINENERDILITIYYQSVLAIFNFFYMKRNFATKQDEIGRVWCKCTGLFPFFFRHFHGYPFS